MKTTQIFTQLVSIGTLFILGVASAGHVNPLDGMIAFTRFDPPLLGDAVGEIYAINPDGTNLRQLTTPPTGQEADSINPSFSPDGKQIVFSSIRHDLTNKNQDIYVMDSWDVNNDGHGDNCKRLTTDNNNDFESGDPAWSPDGSQIVFSSNRGGNNFYELYLMNSDGTNQVKLITSPSEDMEPSWSPDGAFIVFTRDKKIYKVNVASKLVTLVTNGPLSDQSPGWNSINNLVFASYRDSSSTFQVYSLGWPEIGAVETRITQSEVFDINPAWSPDSTHIVFSRSTGAGNTTHRKRHNLIVIGTDGLNPMNISNTFVSDVGADWGNASTPGAPGEIQASCQYI